MYLLEMFGLKSEVFVSKRRIMEAVMKVEKNVCLVVFIVLVATVVDSEKVRHGSSREHGKLFSGDVWKHISNMEQSTSRRFEQVQSKLLRDLEERIQMVNQSESIAHIEKLIHHINEDLTIYHDQADRCDDQVEDLSRIVNKQQLEIEELKSTLVELQRNVANLLITTNVPQSYQGSTKVNNTSNSSVQTTGTAFPVDCEEASDDGQIDDSGFYYPTIKPRLTPEPFKSSCYLNQSGEAWTVIQRRLDGSVDFYRDWNDYKAGFGDVEGEFWLGNDHIYQLTNQGDYCLRIEMKSWDDVIHWAEYRHFRIADEADKYRLHVTGYSGNAGNSLSLAWDNDHNGQPFSTWDNDNDERFYDNCAEHFHGAWWFRSCFQSHLNGVYYPRGSHDNFFVRNGIQWNTIHPHSSLKEVTMMIRRDPTEKRLSNGIEHEA